MTESEPLDVLVAAARASDGGVAEDDPQTGSCALHPLPPPLRRSSRSAVAAAARPGMAGPLLPPAPAPAYQPGPSVIVQDITPDELDPRRLAATLPPRAAREAHEHEHASEVDMAAPPERAALRQRRWPLVSLATVVLAVTAYTIAGSALTERADAREAPPRPDVAGTILGEAPSGSEPHHSRGLPPGLAATLAQAVPPRAPELVTDAGAPPTAPAPLPPPAATAIGLEQATDLGAPPAAAPLRPPMTVGVETPPITPAVSVAAVRARADALRASLVSERTPRPDKSRADASPSAAKPAASAARLSPPATSEEISRSSPPARTEKRPEVHPITVYTYEEQDLFHIAAATAHVTDIALEPGERLLARPTAGDAARWVITVLESGPQPHIFIKPLRSGLVTNLTLTTDRRSYFLELASTEQSYMAGVHWRYPKDDAARRREAVAQAERDRRSTTAISDLGSVRFDYLIRPATGNPSWTPTMVFDDGEKTFIRFPKPVSGAGAPALFVLRAGDTKNAQYINYRVKGDLYVIERVIDAAELRLTTPDTNDAQRGVVRITRSAVGKGTP